MDSHKNQPHSTMVVDTPIRITLLHYNQQERCFAPLPLFATDHRPLSKEELAALEIDADWWMDYGRWNDFDQHDNGLKGHPIFETIEDLYEFNETGRSLAARLELLLGEDTHVTVEPYLPLYTNISVGEDVAAWWHIKDTNYGCVVPIQQLPVSDELKSRLMGWRKCKDENWIDEESRASCRELAHELEEHVLWELNVQFSSSHPIKRLATRSTSCDSVESVREALVNLDPIHG